VLVAGVGVAGLEAVLALSDLAGDRVLIDVLTPREELVYRPLLVKAPFAAKPPAPIDLRPLLERHASRRLVGALAAVDPDRRTATIHTGEEIRYDALVIACGASHVEAVPGAITFPSRGGALGIRALIENLAAGAARRATFALPAGAGWPLPLYELALLTAAELDRRGARDVELALVTPESDPLGLFGRPASEEVARLLAERRIEVVTRSYPIEVAGDDLVVRPRGRRAAGGVVALARLEGPRIHGVPCDANGFIPTDLYGQVVGLEGVYAAGDAVAFGVKQGGLAAQQALAAAETIAAAAGAPVSPRPFKPVLRGLLLTGGAPQFLRSELTLGYGDSSLASTEPLWWPPAKIAGTYLGPALADLTGALGDTDPAARPAGGVEIDVEL